MGPRLYLHPLPDEGSLWEELLSSATGLAGLPRTRETKGPQQWGEGGVPWNTEDPATEALWEELLSLISVCVTKFKNF